MWIRSARGTAIMACLTASGCYHDTGLAQMTGSSSTTASETAAETALVGTDSLTTGMLTEGSTDPSGVGSVGTATSVNPETSSSSTATATTATSSSTGSEAGTADMSDDAATGDDGQDAEDTQNTADADDSDATGDDGDDAGSSDDATTGDDTTVTTSTTQSTGDDGTATAGDDATETAGDDATETAGDDGAETTGSDPCDGVTCFNAGECRDGDCVCVNGFDPDTFCSSCHDGLVELDGKCVPDRCRNNPCNIGGEGHGKSCEVTGSGSNDYECTCYGDYDETEDCQQCKGDQVPKSGHECQDPPMICDGVVCRTGASCNPNNGECRCDDPDAIMDDQGGCHDPCKADPCHIADGGHGLTCVNTGVSSYVCTCSGGHTPASDCEDCPAGETDVDGECVAECASNEKRCDGTCIDVESNDDNCGRCDLECSALSNCESGICVSTCGANEIECGTKCVDPRTSMTHCGASGDCTGSNDGDRCGSDQTCENGSCEDVPKECPSGTIEIPGGTLTDWDDEQVPVETFCLEPFEMTVARYAQCVSAGQCASVTESNSNSKTSGRSQHPVNFIDTLEAETVCAYFGRRLPTDYEWAWAATNGDEQTTYAWGDIPWNDCDYYQYDEPSALVCNDNPETCCSRDDDIANTVPVGAKPKGRTSHGISEMNGNLYEITINEADTSSRRWRIQGGGYYHGKGNSFFKSLAEPTRWGDGLGTEGIGVRCAADPE